MDKLPENLLEAWDNEPHAAEVRAAGQLLNSDPNTALIKLEALAKKGSALSMLYLSDSYMNGLFVPVDMMRAEEWLNRASEAGSIEAIFRLASIHKDQGHFDTRLSP
jgi:TPR repeat protein